MNVKFINPVTGSQVKGSVLSKKVTFDAPKGNKVIVPYDGKVTTHSENNCSGNVTLQHNINGEIYYSFFCNVDKDRSAVGTLSKGESLGEVGSSNVTLQIINSDGKKEETGKFLSGFDQKKESDVSSKSSTYRSELSKVSPELIRYGRAIGFPQLLPFELLDLAKSKIFSDKDEEKLKIKEEIDRIKTLLK